MVSVQMKRDIFWLDDPTILAETYLQFIPAKDMTINQRYNAITLFSLYFLILLFVFQKPIYLIYFPMIIIAVILIMHSIDKNVREKFSSVVETGYIDSNDEIQFSRTTGRKIDGPNNPNISYTCRKPTNDNPFMNPPISDFNNGDVPSACNGDDEFIKDAVNKSFNSDLYRDIDDVFDKVNSQRQFYTVPNTSIPNNQTDFANWLYRIPVTCKEDQEQCLRYEDLRFKR